MKQLSALKPSARNWYKLKNYNQLQDVNSILRNIQNENYFQITCINF